MHIMYVHYMQGARNSDQTKTLVNQLITREENATHTGSFAELHYVQRSW